MESSSGDIYRSVSSSRLGLGSSSNIWRSSAMEVFSRSSRHGDGEGNGGDDDEEALKWAAIEKLPTYLRIRRGILTTEDQGKPSREIDIANLGLLERRNVLDRLVKIADKDNERFLMKLKDRIDRFFIFLFIYFLCVSSDFYGVFFLIFQFFL